MRHAPGAFIPWQRLTAEHRVSFSRRAIPCARIAPSLLKAMTVSAEPDETINIGPYQLGREVCTASGGVLHQARSMQDGTTVLLKLLHRRGASASDELHFRGEYDKLVQLHLPSLAEPLAWHENELLLAMSLQFFPGECLEVILSRGQRRLALHAALKVAHHLAHALLGLHGAGVVHQDIRPANVLVASDGQVLLTDISRATRRESTIRDWPYASPEQTGHMNRPVDHRTDLYSLGIVLHRLLTGQFPFQASDPPGWVHCHLAQLPTTASDVINEIPRAVSDIILKLLAKLPEDRYQSAAGLLADLKRCLSQWEQCGRVEPFPLGQDDVSHRFLIPHRLYGREGEAAALLSAFDDVASTGTPTLVTVSGPPGIGKSALINELQKPVADRRGFFVAGKFDQYKRDIPYATLAQSFDSLVRQILGEDNASVERWRSAIQDALGPNGKLMVGLIPKLDLIIGPQPPVPELPPQDAQRRFHLVLRQFISVFAREEHPLVLFLDDLQWLDAGTLALLVDLVTHPDVRYLFPIGAYRSNEVDDSHPLVASLEAVRQAGGVTRQIELAPLDLADVTQLIVESLHCPPAQAQPLAHLVLEKTAGNPFFTRQFLAALAEEELLGFDADRGAWCWNLTRIQAKGYTDNVVDLIVAKLARLPPDTQNALTTFACLGNVTEVATLALVLGQSSDTVHARLRVAVQLGLMFRDGDTYTFLHDRVQEAVYSMIPETSRAATHLRIGRMLASKLSPQAMGESIFDVVNQLNRGSSLVELQEERERIAELNLLAGQRAKAAAAYVSALAYLTAGAALLAEDSWTRRHELTFQIEVNRGECEFLTGALVAAEARLARLSGHAATTAERATVTCLRVYLYTTLDQSDRAVAVGLEYLRHVGIDWSPHPAEEELRHEYERIWVQLGNRAIEDLIDLPLMTDPAALATLDVLTKIVAPAYFADAHLPHLLVCRIINLSLEFGNIDGSCFAYATLGIAAIGRFGNYEAAFRFGQLGCDLVERHQLKRFEAEVFLSFASFVIPWTRHLATGRDLLRRAFKAANLSGNVTFASYSCINIGTNLLASGQALEQAQREVERGIAFAQRTRFSSVIDKIGSQLWLIRTLRGLTPEFGRPDDAKTDENARTNAMPTVQYFYWSCKLQAQVWAGHHAEALIAESHTRSVLRSIPGNFEAAVYHFFAALARAAFCDTVDASERTPHLEALADHHRQFKVWAANCPENFDDRTALIGAEIARLESRSTDAEHLYEQAVRSARKHGFVHNEGLAHELAGRFYLTRGLPTPGHAHLERARACYVQWGAEGKVRQLDALYSALRPPSPRNEGAGAAQLDLLSLAKASQAISGRIVLDELIDTLMRIVLESAGAQAGHLLLVQGEDLILAAKASVEKQTLRVELHHDALQADAPLPAAILNYVRRSKEQILLPDLGEQHPFSQDPYFLSDAPKSLLCLPILRQSSLVGILYMENRLVTHAFTPQRLTVLELLASQAAISLENAQLYANLERENQERKRAEESLRERESRIRRLVDSNIIGIVFWNMRGGISEANEAFLRMTGYTRDDLVGGRVRWDDLTSPASQALDAAKLAEIRLTSTCTPYEKEFIRKDGSHLPVLLGAALLEGSHDTGIAFVLDLSERKQAEADREARRVAEAANLAKSQFLANMSHELRTPLNGILGFAQILLHYNTLGEREQRGVSVIKRSGEHLLSLINDILDFAKIEAGKFELIPTNVNLQDLLASTVELMSERAERKRLAFNFEMSPGVPAMARVDSKQLSQVLLNLLSNAVKFTDHGTVALRVGFTAPRRFHFEVQDTGVGIPLAQQDSIFQPFVQVGESQRRSGGTGLGLAISKQLVRHMGGDIELRSVAGQGSTFTFDLDLDVVESDLKPADAPSVVTGYAGPRRKILVVDDVSDNRDMLTAALMPLGFDIGEAASGSECIDMVRRFAPDLIVLDLMMEGMGGLEAMRRLREQPLHAATPVIMVSASASASDAQNCIDAGANAFLPKPIDLHRLVAHIGTSLNISWCEACDRPTDTRASDVGSG